MSAPNIRHLDDYLGTFYEDNTEKKVASAKNILILLLNLNNMETLINHCKKFHLSQNHCCPISPVSSPNNT